MAEPERNAIAVSGASGFVGGRLVAALASESRPTIALTRAPRAWIDTESTALVDLLADDVAEAIAAADVVVHLAGHNETIAAKDPRRALHESLIMTERLLDAACTVGVTRIIYVSTVHVYGTQAMPGTVLTESMAPEPTSQYAVSRLSCEHLVRAAPVESVVLRLSNAVGAPQHPAVDRWTLLAAELTRSALIDGVMQLRTPGLQWRDFVDLGYVSAAIIAATDPTFSAGTYNLASGTSHTVRDLAHLVQDTIATLTGATPHLDMPEATAEPTRAYTVATDRLRSQGVAPAPSISQSVEELVRFCIAEKESL